MNFKLGLLPHITAPPTLHEEEGRGERREEGRKCKEHEFFQKLVRLSEEEVRTNPCGPPAMLLRFSATSPSLPSSLEMIAVSALSE